MSIKEMTNVWEHSSQSGTTLLQLLAIADTANDDGIAYPGQWFLAERVRVTSTRTVARHTDTLVAAGELYYTQPEGKGIHYVILVGCSETEKQTRIDKLLDYVEQKYPESGLLTPDKNVTPPLTQVSPPPRQGCQGTPDKAVSPDPLFNHHLSKENGFTDSQKAVWRDAYTKLQLRLPAETFDAWLKDTRLLAVDGDTYVIGVADEKARQWVSGRLGDTVRKSFDQAAGQMVDVRYEVVT